MTKIAGSGSISQKYGSEDPDPDPPQNVMNPKHCFCEKSLFYNLKLQLIGLLLCARSAVHDVRRFHYVSSLLRYGK
jgi:hypothetical protein